VLVGFLRHAHRGLRLGAGRLRTFSERQIDQFLNLWVFAVLEGSLYRAPVSRFPEMRDARWWNRPALEVVHELTGRSSEDLIPHLSSWDGSVLFDCCRYA
jgi:hypothetical protein